MNLMNLNIKGVTNNARDGSIAIDVVPPKDDSFWVHISVLNMRTTGTPSVQFRVVGDGVKFDMRDMPEAYSYAADLVADMAADAEKNGLSMYAYIQQHAMHELCHADEAGQGVDRG